MKILIENEIYPIQILQDVFDDPKFYKQNGLEGKITSVGYYHSFEKNSLVFMLPKVFMRDSDKTVFGCEKDELINLIENTSIKHKSSFNWVRQLSVHFYNSLSEYKRRSENTSIIHNTETFELNTNLGNKEYSFLDLLLSFVNFYKKNKQQILFKHIEFVSNQAKKPKWEKTIRKSTPIILNGKTPIYIEIRNKKKIINTEEELLTYFFSILNHLNKQHKLNIKIDKSYHLIEGLAFDKLCLTGSSKLRKIKHRYFSDTLKKMYGLCDLYFSQYDKSSIKRKKEDFLAISNYNIVFEDMVDKLFSDKLNQNKEVDNLSLDDLKYNDDGKIIDHIFDYKSLIDTSDIFYIGDSKYYKSGNEAGKLSKYKQFTYAKNVIQFNIDLLNKNDSYKKNIRYRDKLTEGYNITPNFFVYGYIDDVTNYEKHSIEVKGEPISSFHFKERLFDRDTLFVHQYKINFLYVLKAYTHFNHIEIETFRKEIKETFRTNFLNFFNVTKKCGFELYEATIESKDYKTFIDTHFKKLNGKCFCTIDNRLLLAKHNEDNTINDLLSDFKLLKELK